MSALGSKLRLAEGNLIMFWCPGCKSAHGVVVESGRWNWDGDVQNPTFTPSIKVEHDWWNGKETEHRVCHSFVRQGRIMFLGDCTHSLRGRLVDLPAFPKGQSDGL